MLRRWIALLLTSVLAVKIHGILSAPAFQPELVGPVDEEVGEERKPLPSPPLLRADFTPAQEDEPPRRAPIVVRRAPTPALSKTLNVLLVGIDRRPGERYGGRPDTIVIAALSKKEGHLGLISVPRDLYVEIPEHGMDRINATFSVAVRRKENTLALLKRVLEDTLELPISHTLAIDLGGFEELIDALGGVDVEVPCPISDNFIDDRTKTGRRLLEVEAGLAHLDGITASLYVRSRHGRSDFSRARRQQAVLFGILHRFESIAGLSRLPEFLETLGPLIASDMSRAEVLRLAQLAMGVERNRVHGLVLGAGQAHPHYTPDGKAVLLPQYDEIDRSLARLFSAPSPGSRPGAAPCPKRDVALAPRKRKKSP